MSLGSSIVRVTGCNTLAELVMQPNGRPRRHIIRHQVINQPLGMLQSTLMLHHLGVTSSMYSRCTAMDQFSTANKTWLDLVCNRSEISHQVNTLARHS